MISFLCVRHRLGFDRAFWVRISLAVAFVWGLIVSGAEMTLKAPTQLFVSGQEGYHTFRIPALIALEKGIVLSFCEGRKNSGKDSGDIDLVMKRSMDGGESWGPLEKIWDDGPNTCGNPCPVIDRRTGTVLLLMTHNLGEDVESDIINERSKGTRTVWISRSADQGTTWSAPEEITSSVKRPDWTWYATGPGVGIQLRNGRLIVPCDNAVRGTKAFQSHIIYSDDGGKTWNIGGVIGPKVNECQASELQDGAVLLNTRSYHGKNRRAIALSRDGGLTFSEPSLDPALIEPVCQAALVGFQISGRTGLLFANPASVKRERMTLRLSWDGGRSWPAEELLAAGPSAYSSIAVTPDWNILTLFETGSKSAYETISLARLEAAELLKRPEAVVFPSAEWVPAPARALGVDEDRLARALGELEKAGGKNGVRQTVVARNGHLLWQGPEASTGHGVWSMTKSFVSTVLGLLVEDGKASLDTLAREIEPGLAELYPAVQLRHFATMTSGYRAQNDEPKGGYSHGPSDTPLLPSEPLFPPGTRYAYWDSAMNKFGQLLTIRAGESMHGLFQRRIAEPMGMQKWRWGVLSETNGLKINGGAGNQDKHVFISALEAARFGQLFLCQGKWEDRQLIRSNWISLATSVQVRADLPLGHPESGIDGRGVYGLNWWVNGTRTDGKRKWPSAPAGTFSASGYNNNDLFVIPEWRIVVVRLGLDQSDKETTDAAYDQFLAALRRAFD